MTELVAQANRLLTSAVVITALALLLYILVYNRRSVVARTFSALLSCVILVYLIDLIIFRIDSFEVAVPWLRAQWLGIAFAPPIFLHFSDALLRTSNAASRPREWVVWLSYLLSTVVLLLVIFTDWVVGGGEAVPQAYHLGAQPFFWVFAVYYFVFLVWGVFNVNRARERCLTPTSKRRMTYMALASLAPSVGIFPYLLIASWPGFLPRVAFWLLLLVGNVGVALMLVMMAYSVAFFGVLTPDRVVKRRMILFLLRGPLLASLVLAVMLVGLSIEHVWGLSGELIMLFGVAALILSAEIGIKVIAPIIDRLIYWQDRAEVTWLRTLDERLLTSTDLHQFLENVLMSLCDLLRTPAAFVAIVTPKGPRLEVVCGPLEPDGVTWTEQEWLALTDSSPEQEGNGRVLQRKEDFFVWDGYWLLPLRIQNEGVVTGVLGLAARSSGPDFSQEEKAGIDILVRQAEVALEDWHLQQSVFAALQHLIPRIEALQRRRSTVRYAGSPALMGFEDEPLEWSEFSQMVRDALSHYWGGPKLNASPLLKLRVVEQALPEHKGVPAKALRAVLNESIERLRPEGERNMTAAEWILYNILDLKFVQGRRVRDVARRIAISESDLYRKQRVAIEEVARRIAEMEQEIRTTEEAEADPRWITLEQPE